MTRRIVALFRPHRARLGAVLALIVVSAGLGMVSPFLLREVLDVAIPEKDRELLAWLVGGMIAISVATGVLGVGQTWLSNVVGQRVMHDLRTQVYRHLQRLSLAFFTRTRTGEIQSRIANDIGGVQTVVTNTATSIVSNVTTVVASVTAMFLLDWRLALFSLGLTPLFVLLARRVGNQRKRIASVRQGAMADISSLVQESLSVSGILLGKTMGRGGALAERFEGESARLADLEVRSRMAGRWTMATVQTSFAVMPALVYLFAGLSPSAVTIGTVVAFTTLQTRLFWPLQSLLNVGVDIQTSTALFERVFEYLDLPVDIHPGTRELRDVRGEVEFDDVWFAYGDTQPTSSAGTSEPTLRGISLVVPSGTRTALVGETGSGKTTLGYLAARLYDPDRGSVRLDGTPLTELTLTSLADAVGVVSQETYLFHASVRENLRFAKPDGDRRGDRGGGARGPDPRHDRGAARGLRHRRRRARLPLLRRREAADRDRPHDPAQPAGARARRGHERARRADRARGRRGPRGARRGAHDDRDRPPALDRPRRRPDRRARPRDDRRARHARGAAGPRRPLRGARRPRRRLRIAGLSAPCA